MAFILDGRVVWGILSWNYLELLVVNIYRKKCMCNSLQGLSRQMKIHEGSRKEEEVCSALYMSELSPWILSILGSLFTHKNSIIIIDPMVIVCMFGRV